MSNTAVRVLNFVVPVAAKMRPPAAKILSCSLVSAILIVSASALAQEPPEGAPDPLGPVEPQAPVTTPEPLEGTTEAAGERTEGSTSLTAADPDAYTEPEGEPEEEDDLELTVGGGVVLYYYQPLEGDKDNFFEIFEAKLNLDATFDIFGLHIAPRFRDTPERGFFPGTTWVEEAYASAKLGPTTLKVGKVYRQFGRFWDNSFYGNAQEYDGLKLDPNHGISLEGVLAAEQPLGMTFFAQFFIIDGTTNYALPTRDTHTIPGAHRRNQIVGRVEPFLELSELVTLKLGLSGEYFEADLPAPVGEQDVGRLAVDATVIVGGLTVWGEFTRQFGRHVTEFPFPGVPAMGAMAAVPGRSSDENNYLMVGGEYTYDRFTLRYNFNQGDYAEVDYKETRHVPGLSIELHKHLSVLLEYALAHAHLAGDSTLLDSSINVTIFGKI
jgi:hypothetical protein